MGNSGNIANTANSTNNNGLNDKNMVSQVSIKNGSVKSTFKLRNKKVEPLVRRGHFNLFFVE